MARTAAGFPQRRERGCLGLGWAESAGHKTDRWLFQRSIKVTADDGIIRVVSSADPFQELSHLILACAIVHVRGNEMSDINIKDSACDLKTRRQRDTIVVAIVEIRRFNDRIAGEQPFGLRARIVPHFRLLQQCIFYSH
jgi:hypothetical protein